MKKYIADSDISIVVALPNGGSKRVSFSALSDGRSVYYTSDEEIARGLERHYRYGSLFRLAEESSEESARKPKGKKTTAKRKETEEAAETEPEEAGATELTEIEVSDMDAAKDYLAEHHEVVRTRLKTEESIRATAREYGIEFKYPE